LPSTRFRRGIGSWANVPTDPAGARISQQAYDALLPSWLPSAADRAFVASVMQPVTEPGKMASWIAPPDKGIKDRPVDYEYVRLA
jgi:benzoyl-CoA 2,3-dioxygenase component B